MERAEADTPKIIKTWLESPYKFFASMYQDHKFCLDCACGNGEQHKEIKHYIPTVFGIDKDSFSKNVSMQWDLNKNLPFEDNVFDVVFSFETIEHLPVHRHVGFIEDLLRVSKSDVVLGTVSLDGPDWLGEHEIWKREKNPHHQHEYTRDGFATLVEGIGEAHVDGWYSNLLTPDHQDVMMVEGLQFLGISNYCIMRKT